MRLADLVLQHQGQVLQVTQTAFWYFDFKEFVDLMYACTQIDLVHFNSSIPL